MDPTYNNRVYAVIPPGKARFYIQTNLKHSQLSLSGKNLIWDQAWDPETLEKLKQDHTVRLLSHEEALQLIEQPAWRNPDYGTPKRPSYRDVIPA